MTKIKFENYYIIVSQTIDFKSIDEQWVYGFKFIIDNAKYELIHNYVGLSRIFIEDSSGWRDLPFNSGTIKLLPDCLIFEEIIVGA